jgi:ABC-type lipoprotein export system ATPase subunit
MIGMTKSKPNYPRGAEWRRWDLHIHTPASQLGSSFSGVTWANYVDSLEKAAIKRRIAVIGVTDYMSIDGYEILLNCQRDTANPRLSNTLLLPNIEFRCTPQTKQGNALNIHLLIDVVEDDHVEKIKRSLRNLRVTYKNQTYGCVRDELIAFAKAQSPVSSLDDDAAYKLGIEQFKPSHTDIFCWLSEDGWLRTHSVVGIANGKDGISGLPIDSFSAVRDELLSQAHFVFSGNPSDRLHYLGLKDGHPAAEIIRQYNSLKPCLHGSDAHDLEKLFEPDKQRYCWIKADPTFLGLLQAIKEPADRTFIGELPDKLREVADNKTYFIDRIDIQKNTESLLSEEWLAGNSVPLNADLVAIIGNKGSGKSALADVIALLGNSRQKLHFSFLIKDRFKGKSGDPAKHFAAEILWLDSSTQKRNLNTDPEEGSAELIRYIPQGHFENLCNEHVTGRSDAFQKELETVIFEHASEEIRLGALDFGQLIERQEGRFRAQLIEYRKELGKLNSEIEVIEAKRQPQIRRSLVELLDLKKKQIDEHNKIRPEPIPKPSEQLTSEQKQAANDLESIALEINTIDEQILATMNGKALIAAKQKAIQSFRDRIRLIERQFGQFQADTAVDLELLGLQQSDIAVLTVKLTLLDEIESKISIQNQMLSSNSEKSAIDRQILIDKELALKAKLNEPQLQFQQNLNAIGLWNEKLKELNGTVDAPETLLGLEEQLKQLDQLPQQLNTKLEQRLNLTGEIFDALNAQRKAREELFKPVQSLIQNNNMNLIGSDYKIQFQATLGGSSDMLASKLFDLIKQNSGVFRGEDESRAFIKQMTEQNDLNQREGVLEFVNALDLAIHQAASGGNQELIGITQMLRKDKGRDRAASEVYDLIYGLSYMEPRYSLLFQDTQIEQLSPGQRGALLLIFYLLVDRGRTPIILDQPEENLDNETVVNLLVPVLSEAKKKRQIIMVTHNPNLAVVCDAEQVIYSSFDRKKGSKIDYVSGSIENPTINLHVVNVLEGTKPAFNNRRIKYH